MLHWWITGVWPFRITTVNHLVETTMTFPNHAFLFFIFKVSVFVFYIKRFCPHKLSKVSLDNTKSSNYILLRQLSREHRSSNIMATAQYRCSPALRLGFNLESLLFHRHHRVFDPPKTSAALKLLITLCCFFFFSHACTTLTKWKATAYSHFKSTPRPPSLMSLLSSCYKPLKRIFFSLGWILQNHV